MPNQKVQTLNHKVPLPKFPLNPKVTKRYSSRFQYVGPVPKWSEPTLIVSTDPSVPRIVTPAFSELPEHPFAFPEKPYFHPHRRYDDVKDCLPAFPNPEDTSQWQGHGQGRALVDPSKSISSRPVDHLNYRANPTMLMTTTAAKTPFLIAPHGPVPFPSEFGGLLAHTGHENVPASCHASVPVNFVQQLSSNVYVPPIPEARPDDTSVPPGTARQINPWANKHPKASTYVYDPDSSNFARPYGVPKGGSESLARPRYGGRH
uniref:Uncharacterized protein n=1 Tax=Chromera velia CCMP2878 TaxID=1169474 RepID=A0A0G4ICA0_9ALVE|eukprot:Cvel_13088.t1-p1 / transcript=Cvel_13088.t1 / gene=Cvel_13088 / organism=Chromera_velia_CCMP2878 / gene_product=hypothetical protein / transcript_product=hypothetical protein / location=Cvel_scaffold881:47587-48606(+) / protein_length=260 / sequence_SO=supercontig / SO=protein_coding / is_pseudo=false